MSKKRQHFTIFHMILFMFLAPVAIGFSIVGTVRRLAFGSLTPLLFLTFPVFFISGLFTGADRFTRSGENSNDLFYEPFEFDQLRRDK